MIKGKNSQNSQQRARPPETLNSSKEVHLAREVLRRRHLPGEEDRPRTTDRGSGCGTTRIGLELISRGHDEISAKQGSRREGGRWYTRGGKDVLDWKKESKKSDRNIRAKMNKKAQG